MLRLGLIALSLCGLVLVGPSCPPRIILVVAIPGPDQVVDGCSVQIVINSKGIADNTTLAATLNGEPLDLEPFTSSVYIANVAAGDPALAFDNTVVATVQGQSGGQAQHSRSFQYVGDRLPT